MTTRKSLYWWDYTTAELSARDLSNTVAILQIGAVEQHGPHLPVRVDAALGCGVLERALGQLPQELDVLVLPALAYGKSDEHISYAGTLTLSSETLARVWFEIAASIARAGVRKLMFVNSHGGQISLVNIVCRDIRIRLGMLAVNCSWFGLVPMEELFGAHEITHGIHGGDLETSAMLALHPDLVAMELAENFVPLTVAIEQSGSILTAEGAVGFGWQSEDLHPAGVSGNATIATAAKGEAAIERTSAALVRLLSDIAVFDMNNLAQSPRYPASHDTPPRS